MNKDSYRAAVDEIKIDDEFKSKLAKKMKEKPRNAKSLHNYRYFAASVAVLIIMAVFVQSKIGLFSDQRIAVLSPDKTITLANGKGTIHVNQSAGQASIKLFIPEDAYSKDYTLAQLQRVFGKDLLPEIPEEFKPESDKTSITFDGKGKILFMSALTYSKDPENSDSPSISIKMNKDELPPKDCFYTSKPVESTIGTTQVVVGVTTVSDQLDNEGKPTASYQLYSAEFIYKGVGYNIMTKGTDGQTMIDLLNSIIE